VERQVLIIYAGNRGYLDEFRVDQIQAYEKRLYDYFAREHADLLNQLAEKKSIDTAMDAAIGQALKAFSQTFHQDQA